MERPKRTSVCQNCGKRYKLPQFVDQMRMNYCFTCESLFDGFNLMVRTIISEFQLRSEFSITDKELFEKYLVYINDKSKYEA